MHTLLSHARTSDIWLAAAYLKSYSSYIAIIDTPFPTSGHVCSLLSQEVFESLSDYVITGKQLCGRTVTVNANNTHLMGVPLCIEHEKVRDTTNLLHHPTDEPPHTE